MNHSRLFIVEIDIDSPMQQHPSLVKPRCSRSASTSFGWRSPSTLKYIQRDRETLSHPQYQPNVEFLADFEKVYHEEFG